MEIWEEAGRLAKKVLSQLNNPHISVRYCFCEEESQPHVAVKLLPGEQIEIPGWIEIDGKLLRVCVVT